MLECFTPANEKPMKIKILKIDFRKGERRHCATCPIARGCLRAAKPLGYTSVIVSAGADSALANFFWRGPSGLLSVRLRGLPNAALVSIKDFDRSGPGKLSLAGAGTIPRSHFKPFEFEIEDLPRVQGNVFTIPGQYAVDPQSRKATGRLRKFVVTGANKE